MKHAVLLLVGALALFGCGGGGGGGNGGSSTRVAFVNAVPDAGTSGLDFALNGRVSASGVALGAEPAFQNVAPATDDVAFRRTGERFDLVSEQRAFDANTDNVVVAAGLLTPPNDNQVPPAPQSLKAVQLFSTGLDRAVVTGNRARLIVLNAFLPTAEPPLVAIDVRNPEDLLNTAQSVSNLAYGVFTAKEVNSGTFTYQARPTGTDQIFVPSTTVTLVPGGVYLVLVTGTEGGSGTQLPSIRVSQDLARR